MSTPGPAKRRKGRSPKGATVETVDPGAREDIDAIARSLGVPDWDVALIGDGAGCAWHLPAGWACVLIDRRGGPPGEEGGPPADARKLFSGGVNYGSLGMAELMPYLHALLWYEAYHGQSRREQLGKAELDVLIITDSRSTADQGVAIRSGRDRLSAVAARQPLWAALAQFERQGYRLAWVWQERCKVALNAVADRMADAAKHAAANALAQAMSHVRHDLPDCPTEEDMIYHFNSQAYQVATRKPKRRPQSKTRADEDADDPVDPAHGPG